MKKGGFLKGKKLGTEGEPTADAIKAMHRELLGETTGGEAKTAPKVVKEKAPEPKPAPKPRKPKPKKEPKVRITVDLPESLHEALKIYTFKKRTTIKDIVIAHVEKLVKK